MLIAVFTLHLPQWAIRVWVLSFMHVSLWWTPAVYAQEVQSTQAIRGKANVKNLWTQPYRPMEWTPQSQHAKQNPRLVLVRLHSECLQLHLKCPLPFTTKMELNVHIRITFQCYWEEKKNIKHMFLPLVIRLPCHGNKYVCNRWQQINAQTKNYSFRKSPLICPAHVDIIS